MERLARGKLTFLLMLHIHLRISSHFFPSMLPTKAMKPKNKCSRIAVLPGIGTAASASFLQASPPSDRKDCRQQLSLDNIEGKLADINHELVLKQNLQNISQKTSTHI